MTDTLERGPSGVASRPVVESFVPRLDDYGRRARTFDGLGFQTGWLWAGVTTADGRRYALLREHDVGDTHLFFGLEIASDIWSPPRARFVPVPGLDSLYWGKIAYEERDGRHVLEAANEMYPPMRVELAPGGHRWVEADWLDLAMEPLGAAMRYACPGPPDSFGYTSQICRVTGTLDGEAVEGFGGCDRFYGEHGVVWGQSKGFRQLEELWWVWAGIGEDGHREHGVAITGPGEFRVGYFHRDGEEPVAVSELQHEVEWAERDGRRLPAAATLRFRGRTFDFRANGNVAVPGTDMLFDWMHGEMTERGGPPLAQRFSWLEYFKHVAGS